MYSHCALIAGLLLAIRPYCTTQASDLREPVVASKYTPTLVRLPTTDPYLISSLNDSTFAIHDGDSVVIHRWTDSKQLHRIKLPFSWIRFSKASSDGDSLFVVGITESEKRQTFHLCRYSITEGRMVWSREISSGTFSFTTSPSNKILATGAAEVEPSREDSSSRGTVNLFDAETGKPIRKLWTAYNTITSSICFSHSEKMLAAGGFDNPSVCLFNLETDDIRTLYYGASNDRLGAIEHLAFSPQDDLLVAAGHCRKGFDGESDDTGGLLLAWETTDYSLTATYTSPPTEFQSVAFDPNDDRLLVTVEATSLSHITNAADSHIVKRVVDEYETSIKFWCLSAFVVTDQIRLKSMFPRSYFNDAALWFHPNQPYLSGIGWLPDPLTGNEQGMPAEKREWTPSVVKFRIPPPCN